MHILLNGEKQEISEGKTLKSLIGDYLGIAVAVNESVISRENWEDWVLKHNDRVDVIAPFQGG